MKERRRTKPINAEHTRLDASTLLREKTKGIFLKARLGVGESGDDSRVIHATKTTKEEEGFEGQAFLTRISLIRHVPHSNGSSRHDEEAARIERHMRSRFPHKSTTTNAFLAPSSSWTRPAFRYPYLSHPILHSGLPETEQFRNQWYLEVQGAGRGEHYHHHGPLCKRAHKHATSWSRSRFTGLRESCRR